MSAASSSVEASKSALARGGSGAAPPRAKAKAGNETKLADLSDEEMVPDQTYQAHDHDEEPEEDQEISMKGMFKMMCRIDQRTARLENMQKDIK